MGRIRIAADFEEGSAGSPVDFDAADLLAPLGIGALEPGVSGSAVYTYDSDAHGGALSARMTGSAIITLQTIASVAGVVGGGGWFKITAVSSDPPPPTEQFGRVELTDGSSTYGIYIERSGSNFAVYSQATDTVIATSPIVMDEWLSLSLQPTGEWELGTASGVILSGIEPTPADLYTLPVTYHWSARSKDDGGETLVDDLWVIFARGPVTRLYPRDDGRGMSSAPRIHPPPRGTSRIIGGFQ